MQNPKRRPVLAVIGQGGALAPGIGAQAESLGKLAIDVGFRVATGGLDGVMTAASRGARSSDRWREGDIVGVLPGPDHADANPFVDVVVPTGLGMARNLVLVSMADVVVAVAGGSGTLSEIAAAWQLRRPLVALVSTGGWAGELGGRALDDRREAIVAAETPERAVAEAKRLVGLD
jgi:uncharacterized protein (TIGR00725 family)